MLLPVGIAAAATTPANVSIVVSTTDDVVNGDTSSPSALVADPGPDGISLREAILAADNAASGAHVYVQFADALAGSTIQLTQAAPLALTHDQLTIAGLAAGGQPTVTVVASPTYPACATFLVEASDVTIRRIAFFGGGPGNVISLLIRGGTGRGGSGSTSPCLSTVGPSTVSDVDIDENTFTNLPGSFAHRIFITNGSAAISRIRISDNTFTNTNGTNDGDAILASNWADNSSIDALTIEGNHFEGVAFGVELQPATSGDQWIDSPATGDEITATQISRNVFDDSGNPIWIGTLAFGDLASGNVMEGTVIDGNFFNMGSAQSGITLTAGASNASGNSIDDTQIVDNLLVGDSPAISLYGGGEADASDNQVNGVEIANDTVVSNTTAPALWSNSTYGSGTGNTVTGLDVRNTIFWGPGWPFNGDVTTSDVQNSIATQPGFPGTNGNIAANPEFVDAAGGDYHLTASSPAIDAGTSVSAPVFDLDDRARVGLPDIGAYEFGATPRPRLSLDTEEQGGSGAVTSAPSGIDCATECSAAFDQGADVSLSATADDGSRFVGWSGACSGTADCQVTMGAAESVTATFAAQAPPPPLPHVTSFSPSAGVAGTHVTLVGTGLADATEVDFTGASGPATIDSDTATKIVVEVPPDATVGPLTVKNVAGLMVTTTSFKPLPKITLLSAVDGQTGNTVTITGTNLTDDLGVAFGTFHTSHGLTLTPATSLTATVPPGFSSGKASVQTPAGTAVSTQTYTITKVTSFSPPAAASGATLTISGQGLGSTNAVDFVGHAGVVPTSTTATSVKVVVPSDVLQGQLIVHTPNIDSGGIVTTATFKPAPTITSFTPADGTTGTSVTISGTNFNPTATTVKFGTISQPLLSIPSSTTITADVPAGFSSGPISVTTSGGTAVSKTTFAITRVTGISPAAAAEGAVVTITGQGLGSATGVSFSGFPIPQPLVGPATPTAIKVAVPAISVSVGQLTIDTPRVDVTSPTSFKPLPRIDSFMPIVAHAGAVFALSGSNFEPTGMPPVVKVGSTVLHPDFVFGGGFLIFAFPSNLVTGMLTMTTPDGTVSAKVSVPPTIQSGPTPNEGAAGTPVSLTGLTFTGTTSVKFANGASAPFTLTGTLGSTQTLTFKVPATAASGSITVTNAGGSTATAGDFTVDPRITSFSPTSGADGATVTLTGSGFGLNSDTRSVKVGSVPATSVTWVSPTSVKFVIPNGAPVNDKIHVTVDGGAAADSATNLNVTATIASFTPSSGPAGTDVEIDGAGFAPTSVVKFNGVTATVTSKTANVLHATVPLGTTPGKITVSRPTIPLTLTSAANFNNTAAITSLSETSGHAGDDLVVTGTDLTGATTVTFGGGATATASSVTATSLHVTVPDTAETGAFTVTTPLGDVATVDDFTMEPAIDSFTPGDGTPGASVVITGSGFTGATDVAFGGTSVGDGNFSVDTATQITATVPAGAATGTITVQTPGGSAESADSFTVDEFVHLNGLGQTYLSTDPLGTYSDGDAQAALAAWPDSSGPSFLTCGDNEAAVATAVTSGDNAGAVAVWVYGPGDLEGHVFLSPAPDGVVTCPTDTDPTWN